jgi:hypothetical protein
MARRLSQTTIDYVVIALSPALIILLVGSLVFFLIEVFYQGEFTARVSWVMACFVFGAVLTSRISIEEGFERAAPFGIALAIAVGVACNRFMEFHGSWIDSFSWLINWGLIALIWWCAHQLTWDCTVIDDSQDSSGEGLLQTAGLERPAGAEQQPREIEGTTSRTVPSGWWQRYVEHQRRPHAPGVWVVYFSLAALPLFGIGQWFIPATDVVGRRYAFWLLCVYVGSGLGLLLSTSFLGLRRYLRQRRIEMPTLMANLWLGIGGVLILLLLVFAALLPRPSAEYAISQLPISLGSPQQHASAIAPVPKDGTQDEQPGTAPDKPAGDDSQEQTDQQENQQDSPSGDASQADSSAKGNTPGKSQDKSGKSEPKQSDSAQGQKQSEQSKQGGSEKKGEQSQQSRDPSQPADQPQETQTENRPPKAEPTSEPQAAEPSSAQSPQPMPDVPLDAVLGPVAELLKWAFYAIVVLAVLYIAWRSRHEILAAIREFLAAWSELWSSLWGRKRARTALEDSEVVPIELPPAPFASYADPFATGIAGRYSHEELVRYSFEAFEAWARENGCQHSPDQTPHELAREVSKANKRMAPHARNLAELYALAAYAEGELPPATGEQLQSLWQQMRSQTASPW